jgi:hypothetical protein
MAFSIMTLSIKETANWYTMLSVAIKPIMLNVIIQRVIMLNVIILSVMAPIFSL